ncbi:MAG: choice-of-anchor B family protein, partial [Flavobacteriales bacterium]|nr:choice-of-anchor B family protein [Flavobacteriales bacterium]
MKKILFLFAFLCILQCGYSKGDVASHLIGKVQYPSHLLNAVWGYADKGKEYAIVGTYDGISIVDVTYANEPKELHFIPTVNSVWKDIQTYGHYAYVVHGVYNGNFSDADGLLIIDLNTLNDEKPLVYRFQTPDFQTAHNIFIDVSTGRAYLFGVQERGGALILDLSQNPTSPSVLGSYDGTYLHDGYVRDGILYGCADKNGRFLIVDVKDPAAPKEINSAETPNRTTHNAWLSDDSQTLFTTDEKLSAFITSFDISDTKNIQLLGKVRA